MTWQESRGMFFLGNPKGGHVSRLNQNWKVEETESGKALAGHLTRILEISNRQAKGLIDGRCVFLNGQLAESHGQRVNVGDEVKVDFDPDKHYEVIPRKKLGDMPFEVLWEDEDLIFVSKPAGLLTVPTEKTDERSLADEIIDHYEARGFKDFRLYVVHRLDRYTSGVLVFAKTKAALRVLKDLFAEHRLNRVYHAILVGELQENSGTLRGHLLELPHTLRVAPARKGQSGKEAVTHFRVLERLPGHTLVELKLETGRRNQIRVQFAQMGHPLLGDQVYGRPSGLLDHQALHAQSLGFRHPVKDEPVLVECEAPEDFKTALQTLRGRIRLYRAQDGKTGEAPRTRENDSDRPPRSRTPREGSPDRPSRRRRDGQDRPPRRFGNDSDRPSRSRTPREGAPDRPSRPRRDGEDRPPRSYGNDQDRPPRSRTPREGAPDRPSRPRRDGEDRPPRSYGNDQDRPPRSRTPRKGAPDRPSRPKRDGEDRPPRSYGNAQDRPPRSRTPREGAPDGPSRPRRNGEDRPPRSYGNDQDRPPRSRTPREGAPDRPSRPRRDGEDRPPRSYGNDQNRPPCSRTPREGAPDRPSRGPSRSQAPKQPLKKKKY